MAKEAQARIKINDLLTTSGWRLLDDPVKGKANVSLESNVKIENNPGDNFEHVETRNGFVVISCMMQIIINMCLRS